MTTEREWEKEFDDLYALPLGFSAGQQRSEATKAFIRGVEDKAYERGRAEVIEEVLVEMPTKIEESGIEDERGLNELTVLEYFRSQIITLIRSLQWK